MKKAMTAALVLAVSFMAFGAGAQVRTWDNLDWWAQSGAKADPVKDSTRDGYWWWPTDPVSNADDGELWGNRGVVYSNFTPKAPEPPAPPVAAPPPPPAAPPAVTRQVPVFNHVLFDFDKSVVKPEGVTEVGKVVALLKQHPKDTVTVEGHTDNVNRSGDPQYNQKLGQRRADAVAKVLTDGGVDKGRVSTQSFGDTKPAVPNSSDANRALNRRVIFVYKVND